MRLLYLVLSLFLVVVRPGDIITDNIEADFNNAGKMTTLYITVSLQHGLSEKDYLRIEFPTGFNPNFPSTDGPIGFWTEKLSSCDFPVYPPGNAIKGTQNGQILLAYFQQNGVNVGLKAQASYILQIVAPSPISATPGYYAPIKMFSTPVSDLAITDFYTYDENLFAGSIEVVESPVIGSMTIDLITQNGVDFGAVSETHNVTFQVTPSLFLENSARLYVKFTSGKFSFEPNSCNLVSAFEKKTVSFSYQGTSIWINIIGSFHNSETLEFNCTLTNPPYTLTDTLLVRTMYTATETILEEHTLSSSKITVTPLNWEPSMMRVAMAWGFDISDPALVPPSMKFYRSTTSNPTYNTIWFYFSNTNSTISNQLNKGVLTTTSDTNFRILASSLTTSLPPSYLSVPKCSVDATNTIICDNVGPLDCSECVYYIAFKWAYISSTADLTFPATFGEISLQTSDGAQIIAPSKYNLNSRFTQTSLNPAISIVISDFNNPNYRGNTPVHSLTSEETLSTRKFGLVTREDPQSIVLRHQWSRNMVTSAGSLGKGDGIEYFTTPIIVPQATITCQGEDTVVVDVCEMITVSLGNQSNMTRFRFSANPSTAQVQFPSTPATTSITFSTAVISKVSSIKVVDDAIYDFYGRGVEGAITTGQPDIISTTSQSEFLINAYAISEAKYSNVNISLSAVWSNNTNGNIGELFPTIVTITGQFTDDEADTVRIMSIFFSDLTGYEYTGNYSCGISTGIPLNCQFQKAGEHIYHPLFSARLDVDFKPALSYSVKNKFTLSFPVKTPANFGGTYIGLAVSRDTVINNDYEPSHLYIYNYLRIDTSSISPSFIHKDDSFDFDIPMGVRFGEEDLSGITNIPLNFVIHGNNELNSGAGIQFCSKYNAFQTSFFRAVFPNTGTGIEVSCPKYQYVYGTETRYCANCPFTENYDTVTKSLKLAGLTFPGIIYPSDDFFAIYSDNRSIAIAKKTDNLSTRMKVNFDLELNHFESNPQTLRFNSLLNRLSITFTPAYPIPVLPTFNLIVNNDGLFTATLRTFPDQCVLVHRNIESPCTITDESGIWKITGIPSSYVGIKDEPIQINVDGVDLTSSATTEITGSFSVKILSDGTLVQENWEFQNGTFTIEPSNSPYGSLSAIEIIGSKLDMPFTGYQSRYSINFTVDKAPDLIPTSYLIEMPFPSSSTNLDSACHIQDADGQSSSFFICSFKDLTHLELKGKLTPTKKKYYNFLVIIDHIKVPAPGTVLNNLTITQMIGSTVISKGTIQVDYNLTAVTELEDVDFVKNYATPGEAIEMLFSFPAPFTINYDSIILLHFPFYYPETIATGNLACLVGSINRACNIIAERTLAIQGSLLEMNEGDTVDITIFGVIQPITNVQNEITLVVNAGNYVVPLDRSFNVPDLVPSELPGIFHIINATVEATDVRSLTNYELYFNLTIPGDSDQYALNILLPHSYQYDLFQGDTSFQCTFTQITDTQNLLFLPFCERLGSRIKVIFKEIVPNNILYQLRILNVLNPEYERCDANKISFSVSTADFKTVFLTTPPNSMNMPRYNFSLEGQRRQMRISTFDLYTRFETPLDRSVVLTLTKGTLSLPIRIASREGEYFLGDTVFFVSQLYFTAVSGETYQRDIIIQQGFTNTRMILGCDTNTISSTFEVKIWKGELEGKFYNEPPRLLVKVVDTPVIIPVPSRIIIPPGGNSLPISFDLREYMPYESLWISISIPDEAAMYLAIKGPSIIRFNREVNKGSLVVSASSTVDVGRLLNVTLSLGGRNAESYRLENPVVEVGFTQPPSEDPIVKFIQPEQVNSTIQRINALSNQPGTLYYAVLLNQTRNLSCEEIVQGALGTHVYDKYDPTQIQYHKLLITTGNVLVPFTVFNLRATAAYLITGCLEGQMNVWSPVTKQTFTMKDNNSTVLSFKITYAEPIGATQEEKFLCFLSRHLEMPKEG